MKTDTEAKKPTRARKPKKAPVESHNPRKTGDE